MEKIALIAPSESLIPFIRDYISKDVESGQVVVQTIDVTHIKSEYRRLCCEGYGVIIARGGTFLDLLEIADSAIVMEMRVQTSDILMAVKYNLEKSKKTVHIVIYQKLSPDLDNVISLFNFPVKLYRYANVDEMKSIIEGIDERGALVVTSPIAESITERKDLIFVPILVGKEPLRETVERAKNYLKQFKISVQRMNMKESILANIDEGIIIFDEQNIICEMNTSAEKLLNIRMDDYVGKDIGLVIQDMPEKRNREICFQDKPLLIRNVNNRILNIVIAPFLFYKSEERYIVTVQDVTKIQEVERRIRRKMAQHGLAAKYRFDDIVTRNVSMLKVIERAKRISDYDGAILINGENGTGKELFAQGIHNASQRRNGPFVAVNCAALSETLLESELFGYVGGSFTGARKEGKAGLFELAHEGTIFFDEINSMSLNLQAKILRVMEQNEVMRVGSDYVIPLDVRIISASNQSLPDLIRQGKFRKDLYFRLSTFEIKIPTLTQRKDDILFLFKHFLAQYENTDPEYIQLEPDFEKMLMAHSWQGNVRELKSTALRYHAFNGDYSMGDILSEYGHEDELVNKELTVNLSKLTETVETLVLKSMLDQGVSKTDIAKAMGISRQALYKKIDKLLQ